ncbi:MAG: ribonuclease PH [Candidatus Lambdaproteobacteria bacterium]|nr:ribonuclease PH [Candidatus Lambdaproteobacteria bacterium]
MSDQRGSLSEQARKIKSELIRQRADGRGLHEPRPITIDPDFTMHAEGSVLIATGRTKVLCTASVEARVPPFLKGSGQGWVTAEYSMLPRATNTRTAREVTQGRAAGRTLEIQRLIGRSLRSVVNLEVLGERTIWIDCDVLQADGGTRTASITGGFVALVLALRRMAASHRFRAPPVRDYLSAISVGLLQDQPLLDLDYDEDYQADVDMNVVMTGAGGLVEVQCTAEGTPFAREKFDTMLDLAGQGIRRQIAAQQQALGGKLL